MSGVSAIQQSQVRLNGAKQPAYRSPLQIAASHGQSVTTFLIESARVLDRKLQLQRPSCRETLNCKRDVQPQAHSYCHVERSETSLIVDWERGEMPEILRFAQDDSRILDVELGILGLQSAQA